jgi:hypothetical protein
VKVSNDKGKANHIVSESCAEGSNPLGEALTGEQTGRVLSRERRIDYRAPTSSNTAEGNIATCDKASAEQALRGQRPQTCLETLRAGIGRAWVCPVGNREAGLHGEV